MKGYGGTGSEGLRSRGKSHVPCRRCGRTSYHVKSGICASCGYGRSSRMRSYNWKNKRKRA